MFNFQPKVATEEIFNLRDKQVWEVSKLHGKQVYYMQADNIETDDIWGEVVARDFLEENSYAMYATRDNDILYIPTKWFTDVDVSFVPVEGDLIYYGDIEFNALFEIVKVGDKTEDYEGDKVNGRLYNYKLYLKLYDRADDDFTGFDATEIAELENIDNAVLDSLNADLQATITLEDVKSTNASNPFGELD